MAPFFYPIFWQKTLGQDNRWYGWHLFHSSWTRNQHSPFPLPYHHPVCGSKKEGKRVAGSCQYLVKETVWRRQSLPLCFYLFALTTNKLCLFLPSVCVCLSVPSGGCSLAPAWGVKVNCPFFCFLISELQEKEKLDAEREKLERLQELYSEQKTQLDNCPESMREQLQQQLKRVSSTQEHIACLVHFCFLCC